MRNSTISGYEFHVPPDWPVLVLEDNEERISWFRSRLPDAVFAKSAHEALGFLTENDFKLIFLDHDLHWMHADNSIFKGTGKEVAQFLAQTGCPAIIVIHSKNEEGVAAMKKCLPNARIARFGDFEITPLVND